MFKNDVHKIDVAGNVVNRPDRCPVATVQSSRSKLIGESYLMIDGDIEQVRAMNFLIIITKCEKVMNKM